MRFSKRKLDGGGESLNFKAAERLVFSLSPPRSALKLLGRFPICPNGIDIEGEAISLPIARKHGESLWSSFFDNLSKLFFIIKAPYYEIIS